MTRSVLSRALNRGDTTLPVPWSALADKIEPEPGFLVNVIAAPGVGKSLLGLRWAYGTGQPSLVISLDTDLRSQALRVVAMLRDLPVDKVKEDPEGSGAWLAKQHLPVRWSDTAMTGEDLGALLEAEKEYLGVVPSLVVADSVGDFTREESYEEYVHAFSMMHKAAKKYRTVVLALHHLKRSNDGTKPVSLNDALYTGEKQAEIVLGLWRPEPEYMRIGILKNRMGAADRNGEFYADLKCDLSRAQVRDFTPTEHYKHVMGAK